MGKIDNSYSLTGIKIYTTCEPSSMKSALINSFVLSTHWDNCELEVATNIFKMVCS